MFVNDLTALRIKTTLTKTDSLDFPCFLLALRKACRRSRRDMSAETRINPMRLFYLEKGFIRKRLTDEEISSLSQYFGIAPEILKTKEVNYLNEITKKYNDAIYGDTPE